LNFPELKYYPSLVNHAQFIISPMSSMTLEAGLFDVPAMVIAYDDGCHTISGNLLAQYCHFEGCRQIPGWFFANRLEEIKPLFKRMITRFLTDSPEKRTYRPVLSEAMKLYHFHDHRSYAQRLLDSVTLIHATAQHQRSIQTIKREEGLVSDEQSKQSV
jgi:hypothetical protein